MTNPVTMRRRLRSELKRLRVANDLTQKRVADDLDWSQSKVIRIENGTVAVSVTDLHALLRLYKVSDDGDVDEMVEMARGSKRQPFSDYRDTFQAETLRYFAYESSATIIRQVEPLLVPGLLQVEEYARAILESYDFPAEKIDSIWASREERQALFDRSTPPECFFILDEAVVRRQVGGSSLMRRQLDHLVEMSARRRVTIQILPFSIGAHRAMRGPFSYLEFPGGSDDPDVLYIESSLGDSVFRDDADTTGPYLTDFLHFESIATAPDGLEKFLSGE